MNTTVRSVTLGGILRNLSHLMTVNNLIMISYERRFGSEGMFYENTIQPRI